jgi:hypothetical protein
MNQLKRFAAMDSTTVIHIVYTGDDEELYSRYCSGIASEYGILEVLGNNLILLGGRVVSESLILESEELDPNMTDDEFLQYAFYSKDTGVIFAVFVLNLISPIAKSYRSAYSSGALSLMDITDYDQVISIGDFFIDGVFVSSDPIQES